MTDHHPEQLPNLSEILFERMPMGIAILDNNYRILRYNPTWEDFSARYAPPSGAPLVPGVGYFEHIPGSEPMILPMFERVLTGETVRQDGVQLEAGGIISYWDVVLTPLMENGHVIGLLIVSTDATQRIQAQQNLAQRVEERTRELASLLDISSNLGSTLDLEQLLDLILDQLGRVLAYDAASIMILEGETLKILAYRGPIERDEALQIQFSVQDAKANREVILQCEPVIIPDIYDEDILASAIREVAGEELKTTYSYLRCWMGVPLIVKDQVIGMLTLDHRDPGHYLSSHADLALAFANQAAVAIENARLYLETERRAEESETLFAVQQAITSKLEMDETLQMIADEARRLTGTDISAVYLLEGDVLVISYVSGDVPESIRGYRLQLDASIAGRVVKNGQMIQIPDTWEDARVDRSASDQVQARSLLIVPLISGPETLGTITVANRTPGKFSPEDEQLLTKLAANVVISLENAHLYQAEQDRRQVAESMRDILAILNSSQSLPETLNYIAKRASQVMDAEACLIHKINIEQNFVAIEASHGLPPDLRQIRGFPLHSSARSDERILNRKPVWVSNFQKLPPPTDADLIQMNPDVRAWRELTNQHYQSWIAVPLVIDEHVYGSLAFYFATPKEFNAEELKLASTFADQAALAIENARLYAAAEEAAITAERNRLARDLHDAVTQTLFSASLIADVLPKIWERSPEEGQQRLAELRQLTRGALSEMRTLLVELRPAALADTDLGDLIGHQVNAFIARTRLSVDYVRNCEHNPPPEIKEMFYRVTQEAFNNIAKHAEAESVQIQLDSQSDRAELLIQDDGQGFDFETAKLEGLGLGIMAERATNVGAQLEIYSRIGEGSRLKITWQASDNKEKFHD